MSSERDYPTEDELVKIEKWEVKGTQDCRDLFDFIKAIWWMPDWGWTQKKNRLWISTGGWSGNESIVGAMRRNWIFWSLCWKNHRTGGHFRFTIPIIKKGNHETPSKPVTRKPARPDGRTQTRPEQRSKALKA